MGTQSPVKGVVNKLLIVLKSEGLQMLLFQVKGAALSKSWLVFEDPALQSDQNEVSGHSASTIQKGSASF